jgi:hypothetical protein
VQDDIGIKSGLAEVSGLELCFAADEAFPPMRERLRTLGGGWGSRERSPEMAGTILRAHGRSCQAKKPL